MREFVVGIEIGLAESGKMFNCSQHSCRPKSSEKFASVYGGFLGIIGNRTRTHHLARRLECQIYNRGEVRVETHCPARFTDDVSMVAIKFAVAGGEHIGGGGRGTGDVAKAIHSAAFHIHTSEQWGRNASPALSQQLVCLLSTGN